MHVLSVVVRRWSRVEHACARARVLEPTSHGTPDRSAAPGAGRRPHSRSRLPCPRGQGASGGDLGLRFVSWFALAVGGFRFRRACVCTRPVLEVLRSREDGSPVDRFFFSSGQHTGHLDTTIARAHRVRHGHCKGRPTTSGRATLGGFFGGGVRGLRFAAIHVPILDRFRGGSCYVMLCYAPAAQTEPLRTLTRLALTHKRHLARHIPPACRSPWQPTRAPLPSRLTCHAPSTAHMRRPHTPQDGGGGGGGGGAHAQTASPPVDPRHERRLTWRGGCDGGNTSGRRAADVGGGGTGGGVMGGGSDGSGESGGGGGHGMGTGG